MAVGLHYLGVLVVCTPRREVAHWGAGWMWWVVDMVLLKLRGNRGQPGWRTEPTGTSCWPAQELQEPLCAWALRKTQSKFIREKNIMKKALESKKANSNKSQMSSRIANCQLHLKLVAMKMLEFFLTYHHKQKNGIRKYFSLYSSPNISCCM